MVTERTLFFLSSFVGWLTVLLAALGMYALLTYSIGRRLREMGLRQALGASPMLIRLIAREGLVLIAMGLLLGVPLSFALGRLSRALLAELPWSSHGGVLAAATAACDGVAGLLAVAGPAWRAARTDPADALRGD